MNGTLLVVTPYFPPEGGGLEQYARAVSQHLAADRWSRVVVVTSAGRGAPRSVERDGDLWVHRLPATVTVSNTRVGHRWARELARIIDREQPDLVNAHAPVPGLADLVALRRRRPPLVVTYHAGSMRKGVAGVDLAVSAYERSFGRRLVERADWVIASSDFVRDTYLAHVRATCTTITPGVDLDRFHPAAQLASGRLLFVGGLGRADRHKGLHRLLAALAPLRARHPGVTLDVIGQGDGLDGHRDLARELGVADAVTFHGRLAGDELAEAFRAATCLVLPTTNDSLPMVLLEAMASGLPVVASAVGGIPGLVTDGVHGHVVPPDDPGTLLDRLDRVLADPAGAARLGAAGRRHVEEGYSWSRQAARTEAVLDAVLDGRVPDGRTRLAVVAPHYAPRIGGLERYAHQVASRLQATGRYEVVVVTSNDERRRREVRVDDGVTVVRLPVWARVSNTPVSPTWPMHLRRTFRANRIELVHAHAPVPYMAESALAAAGGRPFVLTYHAGSMRKGQPLADIVIGAYERFVLPGVVRRADAVVAVSRFVRDGVLAGVHPAPTVIPPGVDLDRFHPAPPGRPDGERDRRRPTHPVVLFVGRLERTSAWKGVHHLVRAFAEVHDRHPDAELVLIGTGDAAADHRDLAEHLGVGSAVRLPGLLVGDDLVDRYRRATVTVLPSTTDAESFGMTLLEAMACGTPVVGSRVGGIPQLVTDGVDGLLVPPADPTALAGALTRVIEDGELAAHLRAGGLDVAAAHSWPAAVAAYDALFAATSAANPEDDAGPTAPTDRVAPVDARRPQAAPRAAANADHAGLAVPS
jgi:glycosyltransferase involved in cell wall biosynthesis